VCEAAASPQARYGVMMEMMTASAIKTQIKRSLLLARIFFIVCGYT
jgi:hypothetical protein